MVNNLPDNEIRPLKAKLTERRAVLLEDIRQELIRSDESRFADLAGRVHDAGDESVADLLVDVDTAIVHRHISELRHIEEALRRMSQGGYGYCDTCGERIEAARLSTQPTAIRCLGCQDRYERVAPHGVTPRL